MGVMRGIEPEGIGGIDPDSVPVLRTPEFDRGFLAGKEAELEGWRTWFTAALGLPKSWSVEQCMLFCQLQVRSPEVIATELQEELRKWEQVGLRIGRSE